MQWNYFAPTAKYPKVRFYKLCLYISLMRVEGAKIFHPSFWPKIHQRFDLKGEFLFLKNDRLLKFGKFQKQLKNNFLFQIWVKPTFCQKIVQLLLIWIWVSTAKVLSFQEDSCTILISFKILVLFNKTTTTSTTILKEMKIAQLYS